MALQQLKTDGAGGMIVLSATNFAERLQHKFRFHVPTFGAAGAISDPIPLDRPYVTKPAGHEQTIGQTAISLYWCLRGMYTPAWQFRLAACYLNSQPVNQVFDSPGPGGGILVPQYPVPHVPTQAASPLAGTSSTTTLWLPGQVTVSFSTVLGGRARLVMLSSEEWDPAGSKSIVNPGTGGTPIEVTCGYLTGYQIGGGATIMGFTVGNVGSGLTMVEAHDGTAFLPPCVKTNTMNKRVRRSLRLI